MKGHHSINCASLFRVVAELFIHSLQVAEANHNHSNERMLFHGVYFERLCVSVFFT